MPSLEAHPSLEIVKGLYLGDAGAGKTGSLASLVAAGYKLRIYDFDNLLTPLVQYVMKDCPAKIGNVAYQTFTDKMKGPDSPGMMQGKVLKVMPFVEKADAFARAMKQLNYWKTPEEDLGKPGDWGPDVIVIIDTLTTMSESAFRYCEFLNPFGLEPQATYFAAQRMIVNALGMLTAEDFKPNVLVLAHIDYDKNQFNLTKGFPRSIGSALNTKIGGHFNCVLQAEDQKFIRTKSTGIIDLKNPVSFRVPEKLPLESGLATFFKAVTTHK